MTDEGARALCAGVIKQAVDDYCLALQCHKKHPNNQNVVHTMESCERFFRGGMEFYSDLDGKRIIRLLQQRYDENGGTGVEEKENRLSIQEENQKKKEYLNGYRIARKKEQRIFDQIQTLRADKMFPGSQKITDMPKGTNQTDLSDYIARFDDLIHELYADRADAVKQYNKIYRDIKAVEDEREVAVLIYRYLDGERWENICCLMDLKWAQVHRIHSNALNNFKMI